nr:unnamed protein product [Digitaria exilis]
MRGGGGGMMDDDERPTHAQIPTSFGPELRACLRCRLVKTYDQFRENGCENCPFLEMERENENVVNCTTPNFTGFIPGCYTLAVSEELPEEYQGICQDNNVQYVPPKRV